MMNDDQIRQELVKFYKDGAKPEAATVLSRAVELGASSELMRYTLFEVGDEFQPAFIQNPAAWSVFSQDDLVLVFKQIAENDSALIIRTVRSIEERVGHAAAYDILLVAVRSLHFIRDDETLALVESLPKNLKEQIALQVHLDWRTIPFVVRTLKERANNPTDYKHRHYRRELFRKEFLLSVPVGLRWGMLGGDKWYFPGEATPFMQDDFSGHPGERTWWQQLRRSAEDAGWRFVRLQECLVRGKKLLLAEVNPGIRGMNKVVYIHDNNGQRGDRLAAGDEVMVLAQPTIQRIPVGHIHDLRSLVYERRGSEIWVKEHELHPVRPPTPEMLKNPKPSFYGEDIPLTPKKG